MAKATERTLPQQQLFNLVNAAREVDREGPPVAEAARSPEVTPATKATGKESRPPEQSQRVTRAAS